AGIERGDVEVLCRDLTAPSPLSQEILGARPYAFLDDAPAEERRTLAVQSRRYMTAEQAAELGRLDPAAIERVREEAWPDARDAVPCPPRRASAVRAAVGAAPSMRCARRGGRRCSSRRPAKRCGWPRNVCRSLCSRFRAAVPARMPRRLRAASTMPMSPS